MFHLVSLLFASVSFSKRNTGGPNFSGFVSFDFVVFCVKNELFPWVDCATRTVRLLNRRTDTDSALRRSLFALLLLLVHYEMVETNPSLPCTPMRKMGPLSIFVGITRFLTLSPFGCLILTSGPVHHLKIRFAFIKVPFRLAFALVCIGSSMSFRVF